jgi:hypothetical protein
MKPTNKILVSALIVLFAFASCGKYEEGPALSLLTKKARISGEWEIEKLIVDGEQSDESSIFDAMTFVLEKDGTGKQKIDAITYTVGDQTYETDAQEYDLEWELSDDKEIFRMRIKDEGEWEDWDEMTIQRLTNSEFWLDQMEEDVLWEMFLVKK